MKQHSHQLLPNKPSEMSRHLRFAKEAQLIIGQTWPKKQINGQLLFSGDSPHFTERQRAKKPDVSVANCEQTIEAAKKAGRYSPQVLHTRSRRAKPTDDSMMIFEFRGEDVDPPP